MNTSVVSLFFIIALGGCSKTILLNQFDGISVSDPKVSNGHLEIRILNETGHELCYFEDGLFYGSGVIEGSSGTTEILRPIDKALPIKELKFHNTGYMAEKLRKLGVGKGVIVFEPQLEKLEIGNDVSFDIFHCAANEEGLHEAFNYSSRLE